MNKYRRQEINGERETFSWFVQLKKETQGKRQKGVAGVHVHRAGSGCVNLYSERCFSFVFVSYVLAPIGIFVVKMVEFFSEAKNSGVGWTVPFMDHRRIHPLRPCSS